MQQQTATVSPSPNVLVGPVSGNLRVAGWERGELMAKTDGNLLDLALDSDPITVSCDEDLILYLPRAVNLRVEQVAGDVSLQAIRGPVALGEVSGDLTVNDLGPLTVEKVAGDAALRNVGPLEAKKISGDLSLRGGGGDCTLEAVGGDASIRDVDGALSIDKVGSDLYVRGVKAGVKVKTGADAALYLEPLPGQVYEVTAGDDLILRLPLDARARLHLHSGSPESIHVDFPGVELPGESREVEVLIGEEGDGAVEMTLTAGDELLVTGLADPWESAADFGVGMGEGGDWTFPPIGLPPDFSERINRRVQAAMERAQSRLEAAGKRAEGAGRRAEIKLQAAMRRAEAKARAAEARARRGQAHAHVSVGRWNWDLTPRGGPDQAGEAVSDDERLAILKMLQEKKISLEEAEKLLAALEGR